MAEGGSYRIPPAYELHAAHLIGGRGDPSTDPAWNRSKRLRAMAVQQALNAIGCAETLRVGTGYRHTAARGRLYSCERDIVYEALVRHLNDRCRDAGDLGIILMDGDGSAHGYYKARRALKLADRHLIEDPLFQGSHRSQWVQMADLAAWAAYQGLARQPGRRFAWEWYERYLISCDVNGGPYEI